MWGEDKGQVIAMEEVTSSSSEGIVGMIVDSSDSTKEMGKREYDH